MGVVRWYPGIRLEDLEKQVITEALEYYPTQLAAANALGIDAATITRIKKKIKKENEEQERSMEQFVATQNQAIRRIKAMAAAAAVDQERRFYQQNVREDRKIENSLRKI